MEPENRSRSDPPVPCLDRSPRAGRHTLLRVLPLLLLLCAGRAGARAVFTQPTNWAVVTPSKSSGDFKTNAINNAVNQMRQGGGGTVFLPAGTYYLNGSIVVQTSGTNNKQISPWHVRILGAQPISSYTQATGDTVLVWSSPSTTSAVIDVQHARNTTIENVRIQPDKGKRFKYGIFFHRVYSAATGTSLQGPPTALNIIDSAITNNANKNGSFTMGVRYNNASEITDPTKSVDQNVDQNYAENLYIQGATDDSHLVLNAAGIMIDGSQVQANYFRGVHVDNCGTGVWLHAGELELVDGWFSNNKQGTPYATSNPSGGGDFVFRLSQGGGHLIQNVQSTGSYRFYTSYYEGQQDLESDGEMAVSIVGCTITAPNNPAGDVIYSRGHGGPLAIVGCDLGGTSPVTSTNPSQVVAQAQWTQGSIVVADSKFNHLPGPGSLVFSSPFDPATTSGEQPKVALVGCFGWDGTQYQPLSGPQYTPQYTLTDPNDAKYTHTPLPTGTTRTQGARPDIPTTNSFTVDLSKTFHYNGTAYTAERNFEDFDNGPVINAALALVDAQGTGGHGGHGTIWFPSGAYVVKTPITIAGMNGVRLLGVGGRSGFLADGINPDKGSALAWDGDMSSGSTLMVVSSSQNVAVEGIYFTTYSGFGGQGATTIDRFVQLSGSSTNNVWIEDSGTDWLSFSSPPVDTGVCNSLVVAGNDVSPQNPSPLTLLGVEFHKVVLQALLIDGPQGVNMSLFGGDAKRAVHTTANGGSFSWISGGEGNAAGQYSDPAAIELDAITGPVMVAAMEFQDPSPVKAVRTSTLKNPASVGPVPASVSVYGNDFDFYAPADQKHFDLNWSDSTPVFAFGNLLGANPVLLSAANGVGLTLLANNHIDPDQTRPWLTSGTSLLQALGGRGANIAPNTSWPDTVNNWKFYSSAIGSYSLSPLSVTSSTYPHSFQVTWSAAPGETCPKDPNSPNCDVGDWVGLFAQKSTPDSQPISSVQLQNATGAYGPGGTTAGTLTVPSAANTYELRYFKNGTTTSVYRAVLRAN